jgi:hypothetical protein
LRQRPESSRSPVPDYDPNRPSWEDRLLALDTAFAKRFQGTYGE